MEVRLLSPAKLPYLDQENIRLDVVDYCLTASYIFSTCSREKFPTSPV